MDSLRIATLRVLPKPGEQLTVDDADLRDNQPDDDRDLPTDPPAPVGQQTGAMG
jgi:hypothetical protein